MKKLVCILLAALLLLGCAGCGGPKQVSAITCSVTMDNTIIKGIFSGTAEKKQPNGHGTFQYSDDSVFMSYTGNWEYGIPVGSGELRYDGFELIFNDTVYTGNYKGEALAGIPHGNGTFLATGTDTVFSYSGNWEQGVPAGEGTLKCGGFQLKFGDAVYTGIYEGETLNGIPGGTGTFTASDDAAFVYSGQWEDGAFSGDGELECNIFSLDYEGNTLTGEFKGSVKDGVPNGYGDFTANNDSIFLVYFGNWENGSFRGTGTLDTNLYTVHFTDGINRMGHYSGDAVDGIAEGNGAFTATNDNGVSYTYVGEWKNGLYNGYGDVRWNDGDSAAQVGTFTDGEFTPTPAEYFVARGTYPDEPYGITNNAYEFLKTYPDIFLTNTVTDPAIQYEYGFQYNAFAKNPDLYGSKLVTVYSLRVVQIFESEYWGAKHTFLIAEDGMKNVYYINMYGHCPNVYENSYITATVLPLDYFTYPNVSGTKIWAIACAGVRIN